MIESRAPFGRRETHDIALDESTTVGDCVKACRIPIEFKDFTRVHVNGVKVEMQDWDRRVVNGDNVVITILPGGGGKKNPLAIILSLAFAAFAIFAAGFVAGALVNAGWSTVGAQIIGSAVGAAISIVGQLILAALFPPPKPKIQPQEDQRYSLTGVGNIQDPYGLSPRVYGRHKIFPKVAAQPFVDYIDDETYLSVVFDFGYGPLKIEDLRIGEEAFENYDGVEYNLFESFAPGDSLTIVTEAIGSDPENRTLTLDTDEIFTGQENSYGIDVDITFPTGLVKFDSSGNRGNNQAHFDVMFREVGSGTWLSLDQADLIATEGIYDEKDDAAPVKSSVNFLTALIATKMIFGSLEDAQAAPYYPADAAEQRLVNIRSFGRIPIKAVCVVTYNATTLRYDKVWTISKWDDTALPYIPADVTYIDPPDAEGTYYGIVKSNFSIPFSGSTWTISAAYSMNGPGGAPLPKAPSEIVGFWLQSASGATENNPDGYAVERATAQPFTVRIGIRMATPSQYEMKVTRRKTEENADTRTFDKMVVGAVRSPSGKMPVNFRETHTILEMRIKASEQLQGSLDNVNAIATSILPVWNGSDWNTTEATSNPAWIIADILTGTANPKPMLKTQLDTDSLDALATYADETSGINQGGVRYRADFVVDTDWTVLSLAKQVASIARADITIINGLYGVIWERTQTTPVQMFTSRNTWDMKGRIIHGEAPHALLMRFDNEEIEYAEDEVAVYSPGYAAEAGGGNEAATIFESVDLFGVTSRGQAWRTGTYLLAAHRLRPESFEFNVDIENLVCQRGDLVYYVHDVPQIGGKAARVVDVVTGASGYIIVDEPLAEEASDSVIVRLDDGTFTSFSPTALTEGGTKVEGTVPAGVQAGDLIAYGTVGSEVGRYIVRSITPGEDLTARVAVVDEAPSLVTVDESGAPDAYTPQFNRDTGGIAPLPPDVFKVEQIDGVFVSNVEISALSLAWSFSDGTSVNVASYEVWLAIYDSTAGEYTEFHKIFTTGLTGWIFKDDLNPFAEINNVGVSHKFRIYSRSVSGKRSVSYTEATVTPVLNTNAPDVPVIVSLTEDLPKGSRTLVWTSAGEPDLQGFIVTSGGVETIYPAAARTAILSNIPVYGSGTVKIRAFDTVGNESADATYTLTPLSEITPTLGETITFVNGEPRIMVNIDWSAAGAETYYEVAYKISDGVDVVEERTIFQSGTSLDLGPMGLESVGDTVEVNVLPVLADGARPTKGAATTYGIGGDPDAPPAPNPTVVENTKRGDRQVTFGLASIPEDISHYDVRVDGTTVTTALGQATEVDFTAPLTGAHTVQVVAVDTSGNYSLGSVNITPRPSVSGLTASESIRYVSRYAVSDIDLAWTADGSAIYYEVWRLEGAVWELVGLPDTNAFTDKDVDNGQTQIEPTIFTDPVIQGAGVTHTYAVVAVGSDGGRKAPADAAQASETALGDRTNPPDVTTFTVEETAENTRRFWWDAGTFTDEPDLAGFQIRWSRDRETTFGSATRLNDSLLPRPPFEIRAFPPGLAIVLIKAVDTVGNVSDNPAVIKVNLGDRLSENVVQTNDLDPSWNGILLAGQVDSNDRIITEDLGSQFYTGDVNPMYTADANLMYSSSYGPVNYFEDLPETTGGVLSLSARTIGPTSLYWLTPVGQGYQTDGELTSATNWNLGTGWSIADDNAVITSASGLSSIDQTVSGLTIGKDYIVDYFVNSVSGANLQMEIDDNTPDWETLVDSLGAAGPTHRWDLNNRVTEDGSDLEAANLTWTGTAVYTTGIIPNIADQAADLDNTKYLSASPTNLVDATTARSIMLWVEPDTIDATARLIWQEGDGVQGISIFTKNDLVYAVLYEASGATLDVLFNRLPAGVASFVGVTFDLTAGEFKLFRNGEVVEQTTGGLNVGSSLAAHTGVKVGGSNAGWRDEAGSLGPTTSGSYFDGRIQYVAHWDDEVLTENEMRALYRGAVQAFNDTAHKLPGRHQMIFTATKTSHKVEVAIATGGSAALESIFWRDADWTPWTSPVKCPAGTNRVRVAVAGSNNVSRVYQMSAVVDVPDLLEALNDVAISSSGDRLSLSKFFRAITAVSITLQDDAGTAETAKIIDHDAELGPLIECYDSSGTKVSGTIDATVQGY